MDLSGKKANSSSLIRLFESVSSVLNQEAGTGGSDKLALTDKKQVFSFKGKINRLIIAF